MIDIKKCERAIIGTEICPLNHPSGNENHPLSVEQRKILHDLNSIKRLARMIKTTARRRDEIKLKGVREKYNRNLRAMRSKRHHLIKEMPSRMEIFFAHVDEYNQSYRRHL